MPEAERLAFKQGDNDLCRIIPFKPLEGNYEFKMSFIRNKYDVAIYQLFEINPCICSLKKSEIFEITYHRSKDDEPAKIQLKNIITGNPDERYIQLPLYNLVEPHTMDYFSIPIPFAKIEFPHNATYKTFNSKRKNMQIIDIGTNNTIELFLCNKYFDYNQYSSVYHNMSLISAMFPIEYYATNHITGPYFDKSEHSLERDKNLFSLYSLNSDLVIMCRHYKNNMVDSELDITRITFIDNSRFLHILAMTQIHYPSPVDGEYPHVNFYNATKDNLTDNAVLLIDAPKQCVMYHDILRNHPVGDKKHEWLKLCTRLKRELLRDLRTIAFSETVNTNR